MWNWILGYREYCREDWDVKHMKIIWQMTDDPAQYTFFFHFLLFFFFSLLWKNCAALGPIKSPFPISTNTVRPLHYNLHTHVIVRTRYKKWCHGQSPFNKVLLWALFYETEEYEIWAGLGQLGILDLTNYLYFL